MIFGVSLALETALSCLFVFVQYLFDILSIFITTPLRNFSRGSNTCCTVCNSSRTKKPVEIDRNQIILIVFKARPTPFL